MFRSFLRRVLPNPLEKLVRKFENRRKVRILIAWNRGLGDIPLGLYAVVHLIRERIQEVEITFLARENLREGFSMLEGVRFIAAPNWKRGETYSVSKTLFALGVDPKNFDAILERPSPTDWVSWQRGCLVPKLKWDSVHEDLWRCFDLPDGVQYIFVQPFAETNYGLWRNWPLERWNDLFKRLEKFEHLKVVLLGFEKNPLFSFTNIIDLRGRTNLFQLLSLVKNRCAAAILPDSGILSMLYYLDVSFPIHVISLWADPNHGVLKQAVSSPNSQLKHTPLISLNRDLVSVGADEVVKRLFPAKILEECPSASSVASEPLGSLGVILLAGGQGSRLGHWGPKGCFPVNGKPLFDWVCEKIPEEIPIAVMTSPLNHEMTKDFFDKKGFLQGRVFLFQQEMLPMLDKQKKPLRISVPDGNGSVFRSFARSEAATEFKRRGLDWISVVPVENILANAADSQLISYGRKFDADVVVKCIEMGEADTSMGGLITRMGRLEILEYTEKDSSLKPRYGYSGMMAIKATFMEQMAHVDLPLHWVWKTSNNVSGWKGERFIFDALPYAHRALALSYPRNEIYAPVKSKENYRDVMGIS